jgi:hypothetical protein
MYVYCFVNSMAKQGTYLFFFYHISFPKNLHGIDMCSAPNRVAVGTIFNVFSMTLPGREPDTSSTG